MKFWLVVHTGCCNCMTPTSALGVYKTEEEAKNIASVLEVQRQKYIKQGRIANDDHGYEVLEIEVPNVNF